MEEAWRWQQQWQQRLLSSGGPELLLLLEHPACYTLGRGASLEHLHFDPQHPPAPLHRLDRGGEVTHHVPGQLVAYPVVDLQRHQPDLHWYLRQLEGMVLDVLEQQGLSAEPLLLEHIENHPLELTQIPMQIRLMALQINHRISHQLARHVVGDFTAAIQPVQRCRWMLRIEMQVLEAGAAAERVASRVFQQQQ